MGLWGDHQSSDIVLLLHALLDFLAFVYLGVGAGSSALHLIVFFLTLKVVEAQKSKHKCPQRINPRTANDITVPVQAALWTEEMAHWGILHASHDWWVCVNIILIFLCFMFFFTS